MKRYNKNEIQKITIKDVRIDNNYKYLESKKGILGIGSREAGIYYDGWYETVFLFDVNDEKAKMEYFNKNKKILDITPDNKIRLRPTVTISFNNRYEGPECFYFDTYQEALDFVNGEKFKNFEYIEL